MSSPDRSTTQSNSASSAAAAIPPPGETTGARDDPQQRDALTPGLYIVATPIGNLRDITLRALDVLAGMEEILAEDTRVTQKLLSAHGIKARLSPYHDHNGAERRPELLQRLQNGAKLALVSDAGTPLVSDPGWKLVKEAADAGVRIVPVPGASALLSALVASALPAERFMFAGFLPPKSAARRTHMLELKAVPATLVFYESGPRLADMLADAADVFGPREAVVARELTKLFEEVRRGTTTSLAAHYAEAGPPRGEIVVLIGPPLASRATEDDVRAALRLALLEQSTKGAADAVAEAFDWPKREVYALALRLKAEG